MSFGDLDAEFKFKPLHAIQLPHLEAKSFAPEFALEPTVDRFYRPDESVSFAHSTAIQLFQSLILLCGSRWRRH
jgi:hypothetical protein